ncbi:ABC transporter permease [Kribbella albertanoniae]|uniref:Transport permease protein n=1 Tax=Kribbella albertanoniae TaxID=1266829 RepID=A0A4V2XQZ0_9ACTN|nr:ABC transporter permease [Kribbella albertanoniae]TDC27895.1 ABC transporter permease [Kribbella albertanoniae]
MSTGTTTSPYVAVLRTETRLFGREPGILFWGLAFPSILLVILGSIPSFREADPGLGGLRLIDIYVPVLVLVSVITTSLQTLPPVLTGYRERGILRRMSATPVRPSALLLAQVVLAGGAALASIVLCLTIGRLVFGVRLPSQPLGYALTLVLTAAAALALGALITAVARTAKIASAIGTVAYFPALFTAGVWVPVQAMPDVMARIVTFTPFGAAAEALGQAAAGDWPAWSHLGVLAGWAAVLSAAAVRWFRWE